MIPICETIQEVRKNGCEMFTSRDGGNGENNEADSSPDKPRDFDGPHADILHAETHGVQVGDGDGNGRQDEDELHEFTKSVDRSTVTLECFIHETSSTGSIESCLPGIVASNTSHESSAEPHNEDLGGDQTDVGPVEQSPERHIFFHVDGVIC